MNTDSPIPTTTTAAAAAALALPGGPNDRLEYQPFLKAWVPAYSDNRKRQLTRKALARHVRAAMAGPVGPSGNPRGNYFGKRPTGPKPRPLTEAERFARLGRAFAEGPRPANVNPFPRTGYGVRPRPRWKAGDPRRGAGLMKPSRRLGRTRAAPVVA